MSDDRLAGELRRRFYGTERPADLIVVVAVRRGPLGADGSLEAVYNTIGFDSVAPIELNEDVIELIYETLKREPDKGVLETMGEVVEFSARVAPKAKAVVADIAEIFSVIRGKKGRES